MRARPGSLPWMVGHDLLLSGRRFRGLFGTLRGRSIALVLGAAFVLLHLAAWPIVGALLPAAGQDPGFRSRLLGWGLAFVLPWLVSQSMTATTRTLYARGDLDLLLSSPTPRRNIFAAHAVAIAVDALGSIAVLLVPVLDVAILRNGIDWLALYPFLVAAAFLAAALGIGCVVGLFSLFGPRVTRTIARLLATLVGSIFVLSAQLGHVLPVALRAGIAQRLSGVTGALGLTSPLEWLLRAASGDGAALAVFVLAAAAAFALVAFGLANLFCTSLLAATGSDSAAKRSRGRKDRGPNFDLKAGPAIRRKEWRLLWRDPWLLSQLLVQIVYTLPIAAIVWHAVNGPGAIVIALGPTVVVIASQIGASLAWIAISSEDAPELLATAPITAGSVERQKLAALAVPLAILLALPMAALVRVSPVAAILTFVFALAAAASTALLNIWHPSPGRRSDLMRRHGQSKLVGLMEHGLAMAWTLTFLLALVASPLVVLPLSGIAALLWINRPRRKGRRKRGRSQDFSSSSVPA